MAITDFRGDYRWLSNFHLVEIDYEGVTYPSSEHAYQAAKTDDPDERRAVQEAATCGKAKRLGQKVTMSRIWEDNETTCKLMAMREITRRKFKNPGLREKLIQTGRQHLVEVNTWNDTFWGVCSGEGENHLGRILMDVRSEIIRGES